MNERISHYKAADKADLDHRAKCPSCHVGCVIAANESIMCPTGRKLFRHWSESWKLLTPEDLDILSERDSLW